MDLSFEKSTIFRAGPGQEVNTCHAGFSVACLEEDL